MEYFCGLDLGSQNDYSALILLEQDFSIGYTGKLGTEPYEDPFYNVTHIDQFEIGTEYPVVVQKVAELFTDYRLRAYGTLIVDITGLGRPVYEYLCREIPDAPVVGISITGGESIVQKDRGVFSVPKSFLVTSLRILFQSGKLKISKQLSEYKLLVGQLKNFGYEIDKKSGHVTYEAIDQKIHDDLAVACSLATWYGTKDYTGKGLIGGGVKKATHSKEFENFDWLGYKE